MATRMLSCVALRQLKVVYSQLPLKSGSEVRFQQAMVATYYGRHFQCTQRYLHIKVYDKDADLENQREKNRTQKFDDFPLVQEEEIFAETSKSLHASKPILRRARETAEIQKNAVRASADVDPNEEANLNNEAADIFGSTYSPEHDQDEGDKLEEEYIRKSTRQTRKLRTKEYAGLIKEHLKAHRLKDAIEVLEQRMLKEDRVKPENYIYNLIISGCAKAGYTRKAFGLFTKMRQRGLKVTGGTYTSLFNACANAPSAEDGLARANHLREVLLEMEYEPNVMNYNAMIKAYGRCGDVKTAYLLADEMMERNLEVTTETFNFLLQACASDKEFGFRHCLLTWHKMVQRGIPPDYYTFHLILRCVRDCGFGDLQTMHKVLQQILKQHQTMQLTDGSRERSIEKANEEETKAVGSTLSPNAAQLSPAVQDTHIRHHLPLDTETTGLEMPNLLSANPHLGSMVSIAEINLPHERFLLLGGITSYLELMKQHKVTPDIETFTTMLEVIPPTNAAEKQILTFIRKIGLKADIDFFNILIKKRSMRFDYEGAKEVLSMIRTAGLRPDIVTYGVLSLGCQTEEAARELLETMRTNDVRINIQILGAMLRQGSAQKNFEYVIEIMQISLDENIKPNDIFLRHLHKFYNQCARAIDARHPYTKSKNFKRAHAKFCDKLRLYNEEQGIAGLKLEDAIKKIKERPYQQYKEDSVEGVEPIKNEKQARKQKLRKYIKKIKIDNLRGDAPALQLPLQKGME